MPAIIVPFIPFGIWELRLPVAWSLNYLVERFNGIDEGSLQPGRGYGSKGFISQGKKLFIHEISNNEKTNCKFSRIFKIN